MRQRTTFVHGFNGKHDPRQLYAEYNAVHVKSLKAAREDRLTLSLYELPQEVLISDVPARLSVTDYISYGEY